MWMQFLDGVLPHRYKAYKILSEMESEQSLMSYAIFPSPGERGEAVKGRIARRGPAEERHKM
jgi:hypothetical protein